MSQLKEEHIKEVKKLKRERKEWETQKKLSELLPTKRYADAFEFRSISQFLTLFFTTEREKNWKL